MKTAGIAALLLVAISFLVSAYYYPLLPDKVASHWNAAGEVDGYMHKSWGLFLVPLVSAGIFLLFLVVPRIDPKGKNIEKFRKHYDMMVFFVMAFMLYIHLLTVCFNLGYSFNLLQMMVPAFAVLFYVLGIVMQNVKMNWFVGIRTPWTLSSEKVWNKTHRLGGKLFKTAGIIALAGLALPDLAIWFILLPVIVFMVYLVVYSYREYSKEK